MNLETTNNFDFDAYMFRQMEYSFNRLAETCCIIDILFALQVYYIWVRGDIIFHYLTNLF